MYLNTQTKILIPSVISQEDIKVLTLFYQPLLGMGAYTLYLTLYQLSSLETGLSTNYNHQHFLDLLNIKNQKFLNYRHKLEALGLLVVYEGDKDIIYSLKTPLTAKEFLNDTILGSYLQTEIGEDNLKNIIALFRLATVDLTKHNNITKSFDEVYGVKEIDILDVGNHLRGTTHNGGTKINYDNFNYETFIESIGVRYQKPHLFNPVTKSNIEKVAYIYQFNNDEMKEVYLKSSQRGEMPSLETLRFQARIYFHQNKGGKVNVIGVKSDETSQKLDEVSTKDIIVQFSKRDNISIDLDTVLQFSSRTDVEMGVINAIVLYMIKEKEGILPNYSYLEKVLETWQNNGVKTTEDAVNYLNKLESTEPVKVTKKAKKRANEPDWLEDYLKNF